MWRLSRVIVVVGLVFSLFPAEATSADEADPLIEQKVVVEEIKLGGSGEPKEYVSIYNISDGDISLGGPDGAWRLDYAKNEFTKASCDIADWSTSSGGFSVELDGILPEDSLLLIERQLNDSGSGSLRIIDEVDVVHDLVGWGDDAPCFETAPAETPASGKSLQRYLECDASAMVDTDDNSANFAHNQTPTPDDIAEVYPESCSEDDDEDPLPPADETGSDCEGVLLNEVLPNPEGSDGGSEFIEIYNPTNKAISMENCRLQSSANSKIYEFSDVSIGAKKYLALYDSETGLTLANASGGTVWLLDHDDAETSEANYPPDLDDDVAWARFDSGWRQTHIPTPGAQNILQATKPCPEGQIRSIETNRCRSSVLAVALLSPCRADQFRNPLTNRCKLINPASSTLKPCEADQFRNPETNRCKKIDSGNTLKPCDPGEERNPETNRCRKVAGDLDADQLAEVKDVTAPSASQGVSWMFAGASMVGALGYGLFEWRREFFSALANIKSKFGIS